jgi:Na+/H+ antiporter NhaD/arsenite permease-like protein
MTNLDKLMEFLVAGIFLWLGLTKILSNKRRPRALGARHRSLPLGLSHQWMVALGLFEIVAALFLVMPFGSMPPAIPAILAATALALLTTISGIDRARRHQSPAPSVALFLLALFVIVGRTL